MLRHFIKQIIIIVLGLTCFGNLTYATSNSAKLKSLLTQITKVKTDINQKEQQQVSVKQQLKKLKSKIRTLEANYQATLKKMADEKSILAKLNNNQAKQQSNLREAKQKFAVQIISAYKLERPHYFKIFLQQEEYQNPNLLLVYHKYIFKARLNHMHKIAKTLKSIELNKVEINKQTKILENLENKQQKQKKELIFAQEERNKILNSLKNKIVLQNQKLQQLISAKQNLEELISQLKVSTTITISPDLMVNLCQEFVWPTFGEITIHFGSPIEQSSWNWSGIIITAPEGQEVHAASSGKVVYAGWFTGYGLLIIVDHGSGYMSLYGHNKNLRKKLNDEVQAGEVIALVGKTGCEESSLYFAIRYRGQPVNPEKWCK